MHMKAEVRLAIIFAVAAASAQSVLAQDSTPLDKLEGWWSYQNLDNFPHEGCADVDGQARVALGRFQYRSEANSVEFGLDVERHIGFYEGGCSLGTPLVSGKELAMQASCSFEDEQLEGIVTIKVLDPNTVKVSVPGWDEPTVLSSCRVDYSVTSPTLPARKLYYGSRAGMTMTVLGASALDTEAATLYAVHTEEDARAFCTLYSLSLDESCVTDTMAQNADLLTKVHADCDSGEFNTFYGQLYRFVGKAKSPAEFEPAYQIYDVAAKSMTNGSSASGYETAFEIFRTLCPTRVQDAGN